MERHRFLKKTTVCLLAIGVSAALFAGCQSKSTANTANQTSSTNAQSGRKRLSPDEMKKQMQDNIQPLITAGTITQDQATKIIDAMTTRNNGNSSNQKNSNGQNNQQNSQQGGTQNNGQRQRDNPLSKLVSDGTITQAQADAVMQKIRGNFKGNGKEQNSQGSNGQSNNSN